MLTGASLVCRWSEVWPEPAGAGGQGWLGAPLTLSLRSGGGGWGWGAPGTEASRRRAWFIKSHQEHCPGTAVIYPHFSLVKCY